jgi:hypothetical protein
VSQDCIAQLGVGQACEHRNLYGSQNLSRTDTEGREPKDAIALSLHPLRRTSRSSTQKSVM